MRPPGRWPSAATRCSKSPSRRCAGSASAPGGSARSPPPRSSCSTASTAAPHDQQAHEAATGNGSLAAINGIGHAAVACDPQFRAALAAHGYALSAEGEIRQLADFVGAFSARTQQIARTIDRYEREWAAAHPGEHPGPGLRRAWDARAWADGRPDKVTPQPGEDLTARWLAELAALGYHDRDQPVGLTATPVGALDREEAVERVLARLAA